MKTYKLYINMPSGKFYAEVVAEQVDYDEGRLDFYIDDDLVASYPSQYTIIEKIIKNEN